MKRLFYPAERPLSGTCPTCGGVLTHIYVTELVDTALPWREGNVRDAPRWICRRCWGVDEGTPAGSTLTSIETIPSRLESA